MHVLINECFILVINYDLKTSIFTPDVLKTLNYFPRYSSQNNQNFLNVLSIINFQRYIKNAEICIFLTSDIMKLIIAYH